MLHVSNIEMRFLAGTSIGDAIFAAIDLANDNSVDVMFSFNGVVLKMIPGTSWKVIQDEYNRQITEQAELQREPLTQGE